MVLLAGLAFKGELHIVELLSQRLGASLFLCRLANRRGLHLLDDCLVCPAGFNRELARQQEIAAKTFSDLHDVAAMAKFFYVFFQNDFHGFSNQNLYMVAL